MSSALITTATKLATRLGIDSGTDIINILKHTAFKNDRNVVVTDEQFIALLIVANQYGLNPWTKEIYAFSEKGGGIVPVVGVDGWSRIVNEHPQNNGIRFTFNQDETACTCTIYRKDRDNPTVITEYLSECRRGTQPWQSHPKRMLRHKSLIQCARIAFGFTGIFDPDEAERVIEGTEIGVDLGRQSDEYRPTLIKSAEASAKQGIDAFKRHWISLSPEERAIIGNDEKERIKTVSEKSEVGSCTDREINIDE